MTLINIRYLVIVASAAMTSVLAYAAHDVARQRSQMAFSSIVEDSRAALRDRMENYALSLNGMAGFLDASDNVTEQDWQTYVASLNIRKSLPGIAGIGLIVPADATTLPGILDAARNDISGEMVIHPETGRVDKMLIRYIAPMAVNAPARGLDIAFEDFRRTAAETARDTGMPQITGPLNLVQGQESETGMLLLRPHYRQGVPLSTVDERRAALVNWVYAPIFGAETLSSLTASQNSMFTMRVRDAAVPAGKADYYDMHPQIDAQTAIFSRTDNLPLLGRTWTIEWKSTPAFEASQYSYAHWVVLLTGLIMTALLGRILKLSADREKRVASLVQQKTRELTSGEEQNRSIVENTVFGVAVLDEENRVTSVNAAAIEIFGHPADQILNRPIWDFVRAAPDNDAWTNLRARGRQQTAEPPFLDMQRNTWRTADGAVRHSLLLRDVTEAVRNSEALRKSEERWNLALQGADIGVFDIDLTTNRSVVSETWRRLMAVPVGDDIPDLQSHFLSRIHPDDLPVLLKADADCLSGRSPRSICEFRVKFPGGIWRYMRSDAVVVDRDTDGRALRMIGAQTDIQALRDAQDALFHSEERFRLVLSHAPVGMAILDVNGRLSTANSALGTLTGHSVETLCNMSLIDLFDPEESDVIVRSVSALHGDSNRTYRGEHKVTRQDGTVRWGLVKVSWTFDSHGNDEIYILQIYDMTREIEANRIKSEFVATVSHELRTPLTSIKGALGLLDAGKRKDMDAAGRRLLDIASANTDRLVYLVNDILDLEKISAGKLDFKIENHAAAAMTQLAIEQNSPLAFRSGVAIELADKSEGAEVLADPDRTAQVLSNLLSNACKYAPRDTAVDVRITARKDDILFEVIDRGPGVPDHFRSKIFKPFSQADSSDTRQKGGTGLGLNISKQIVEVMGGEIGFESIPDVQTVFWFTCPRAFDVPVAAPAIAAAAVGRRPAKRILHLADDRDFAEIVRLSIGEFAHVTAAYTIAEARLAVVGTDFDAIVLDWAMQDREAATLIDDLVRLNPKACIVSLSTTERKGSDDRVMLTLVKSRKGISHIVEQIRDEINKGRAA